MTHVSLYTSTDERWPFHLPSQVFYDLPKNNQIEVVRLSEQNKTTVHCPEVSTTSVHFVLVHQHKNLLIAPLGRRPRFDFWVWEICWRKHRLPTPIFLGFLCGSAGKESACNAGDLGSILQLERAHGEGKGYLCQYSCLENPQGQRHLAGYIP